MPRTKDGVIRRNPPATRDLVHMIDLYLSDCLVYDLKPSHQAAYQVIYTASAVSTSQAAEGKARIEKLFARAMPRYVAAQKMLAKWDRRYYTSK